ncbi:MAG: hypothetical protein F4Y06_04055 [Rhodospirillales bacterium]|nr:hypothetical protein [Rhodospirillales bacterium]MYE19082.1 hypothetical protein [Rhodospirillales bacterium]
MLEVASRADEMFTELEETDAEWDRAAAGRVFERVACGHADLNAARNIRHRRLARLHDEERSGLPTPVNRETDRRLAA